MQYHVVNYHLSYPGGIGIPRSAAAHFMFDEVDKYFSGNPRSSIEEIKFVIYVKDTQTMTVVS